MLATLFPKRCHSAATLGLRLGNVPGCSVPRWLEDLFPVSRERSAGGRVVGCLGEAQQGPWDPLCWNADVACVFAGVSLLLGAGGFPKAQMRRASCFSESQLCGAHLEQVWSLGPLCHTVQRELGQSLPSLQEEKKMFLP